MNALLLCLLALASAAPAATLSGRLRELGGSAVLGGAQVQALGLSASALSGEDGRFSLQLPEGPVLLRVTADDFDPLERSLTLAAQALDLGALDLRRAAVQAESFRVRARREEAPSRTPLKRSEIRRIAGIGRDPLRALQTLPGVITPSDFSGQLAVRGGGPQDNLYFLNELPWPVPFHYGGALSTVHSDLLEGVDLYAAAFPPRWGGVDGAILDARSRAPKRDQLHGQVDANLLLAEGLFEGPLAGRGGWLLSGRRSYFELLLPLLGDRFTAVPRFWDLSAIVELDLGPDDSLRFSGLASDDVLGVEIRPSDTTSKDFEGEFRFRNAFSTLGFNWKRQGDGWRSVLTPYYSQQAFEQAFGKGYGLSIQPKLVGLKEDLRLEHGEGHELSLGGGIESQRYDVFGYFFRRNSGAGSGFVTLSDPAGLTITANATTGYLYLQERWRLAPAWTLGAGLRWQRADRMVGDALDPRASLEWQAGPHTRFSAGWGLYSQFPTPRQLSADFGNPQLGFNRTQHVVAGVEQRLGEAWSLKVEGYDKAYSQRVVEVADARFFSNDGEGYARGGELLLKREDGGRWFGWLSYSYAESWRLEPGQPWRRYQYDQPHTLTLVGSYKQTPAWSYGLRLSHHSGPLITPIVGRYADAGSSSGFGPIYGDPYSLRLGDYTRLDLRSDYAFRFNGWSLSLYAEILNVLNAKNPLGRTYRTDFSSYEDVNNLPRLPYLGLSAEF